MFSPWTGDSGPGRLSCFVGIWQRLLEALAPWQTPTRLNSFLHHHHLPPATSRLAMLQCGSNALLRTVQNARFSSPSISSRALGILSTQGVYCSHPLNTLPTPHGSVQVLRTMFTSAIQRAPPTKRPVNNLDPKHLNMSHIIDLQGVIQPWVSFAPAAWTRLCYSVPSTPFPPHSRGFLYYHSRPGLPPGAGEIRLRVVDPGLAESHSAADLFANGRDLLEHNGYKPWRIHMLQLYTTQGYHPIRQLLRAQGLIDAAQDRETEQRVSAAKLDRVGRSTILDTISDTFVMQLPILTLKLAFMHDECIVPPSQVAWNLHWRDRPRTVKGSDAHWRLYQGSAVVRFELKKAEKNNMFYRVKEGETVLVLRILELLDQASPDGVPFRLPEGGDLIQGLSPSFYWFMHLDKARKYGVITPSSLKILEELYLGDNASAGTTATKSPSV
ncbi:hypothetical protein D9611_002026 [Ephemerocybe angulata]|uniref:Uncharacterized protein n=1 Tax=Ephemerocybe angulata TaxID=980116 RepID=A0A8H5CKL6_9AGAR|nr:hypothetical protein D9611_002026 [Tulosesus angulatus]